MGYVSEELREMLSCCRNNVLVFILILIPCGLGQLRYLLEFIGVLKLTDYHRDTGKITACVMTGEDFGTDPYPYTCGLFENEVIDTVYHSGTGSQHGY